MAHITVDTIMLISNVKMKSGIDLMNAVYQRSSGACLLMYKHTEKRNLEYGTRCKQDIWVAADSCCEKHTEKDFHALTVNETSPPNRYTALQNQGGTDYLNTELQILFMTEEFRKAAL